MFIYVFAECCSKPQVSCVEVFKYVHIFLECRCIKGNFSILPMAWNDTALLSLSARWWGWAGGWGRFRERTIGLRPDSTSWISDRVTMILCAKSDIFLRTISTEIFLYLAGRAY